jgi:hypothetical protein
MKQKNRSCCQSRATLRLVPVLLAVCAAVYSGTGAPVVPTAPLPQIELTPIGTYASGIFDSGGSEITAHDPLTQRLYVVNAKEASVNVLDISNPATPTKIGNISLLPFGGGPTAWPCIKDWWRWRWKPRPIEPTQEWLFSLTRPSPPSARSRSGPFPTC